MINYLCKECAYFSILESYYFLFKMGYYMIYFNFNEVGK